MMIDHNHIVDDSFAGFQSTQQQLQHVNSGCSNTMNELNLSVVNEAYGDHSDLYLHVLRVKPNAGSAQIQEAYFDRRNELFHILSQISRTGKENDNDNDDDQQQQQRNTERKMDAVVCAVRILGDPDLRLQYDDIRTERVRLHNHQNSYSVRHGTASPNSTTTTSASTITHKNRSNNGTVSPSSTLPLSLLPTESIPDVMSSTATVSTVDNNNDHTDMSTAFLDYFSVHESMNISNYFETTVNSYYSISPAVTAATIAVKVNSDVENPLPLSTNAFKNTSSKMLRKSKDIGKDKDIGNDDEHIPNPIPLTSIRRPVNQPRSPARSTPKPPLVQQCLLFSPTTPTLQTPQTLQRRVTTNETITTYGDVSMEQSNDSTLYYDDDDEEEETYYTVDEEDDDDEEDDSLQSRHIKSRATRKSRRNHHIDPLSLSCLDHGMDRIRGEMLDAIDDTMTAFEQVLNVFTIQDDDILAVRSRIDKAKRQVANTHVIYPQVNVRNSAEYLSSDEREIEDYNIHIMLKKSSNLHKRKKLKQFVLPPPPSSSSATRNRKGKSSSSSSSRR